MLGRSLGHASQIGRQGDVILNHQRLVQPSRDYLPINIYVAQGAPGRAFREYNLSEKGRIDDASVAQVQIAPIDCCYEFVVY